MDRLGSVVAWVVAAVFAALLVFTLLGGDWLGALFAALGLIAAAPWPGRALFQWVGEWGWLPRVALGLAFLAAVVWVVLT